MRLSFVVNRDLKEIQREFFSFGRKVGIQDQSLLLKRGKKGLVVRSSEEMVGAALYEVVEEQLIVTNLRLKIFNADVALALTNGLRFIASENKIWSIWLIAERESLVHKFLAEWGFKLMAFFSQNPDDPKSCKVEYWKLLDNSA